MDNSASTVPSLSGSTTQLQCFKTRMCYFYLQQRCARGEQCLFAHSDVEVRQTPDLSKTKICVKWKKGSCRHGSMCNYAHGTQELKGITQGLKKDTTTKSSHGFPKQSKINLGISEEMTEGKQAAEVTDVETHMFDYEACEDYTHFSSLGTVPYCLQSTTNGSNIIGEVNSAVATKCEDFVHEKSQSAATISSWLTGSTRPNTSESLSTNSHTEHLSDTSKSQPNYEDVLHQSTETMDLSNIDTRHNSQSGSFEAHTATEVSSEYPADIVDGDINATPVMWNESQTLSRYKRAVSAYSGPTAEAICLRQLERSVSTSRSKVLDTNMRRKSTSKCRTQKYSNRLKDTTAIRDSKSIDLTFANVGCTDETLLSGEVSTTGNANKMKTAYESRNDCVDSPVRATNHCWDSESCLSGASRKNSSFKNLLYSPGNQNRRIGPHVPPPPPLPSPPTVRRDILLVPPTTLGFHGILPLGSVNSGVGSPLQSADRASLRHSKRNYVGTDCHTSLATLENAAVQLQNTEKTSERILHTTKEASYNSNDGSNVSKCNEQISEGTEVWNKQFTNEVCSECPKTLRNDNEDQSKSLEAANRSESSPEEADVLTMSQNVVGVDQRETQEGSGPMQDQNIVQSNIAVQPLILKVSLDSSNESSSIPKKLENRAAKSVEVASTPMMNGSHYNYGGTFDNSAYNASCVQSPHAGHLGIPMLTPTTAGSISPYEYFPLSPMSVSPYAMQVPSTKHNSQQDPGSAKHNMKSPHIHQNATLALTTVPVVSDPYSPHPVNMTNVHNSLAKRSMYDERIPVATTNQSCVMTTPTASHPLTYNFANNTNSDKCLYLSTIANLHHYAGELVNAMPGAYEE